eukprot:GHVS01024234.1.p1 GENE.GHVS01024234.1~~GHVS01024234.1.p1  ORF type:complete len:390 (+),score=34.65 GHVS01024234.1:130-1170(+)
MAILVLARAYVRSRFTPTVFRSWRLAAGRLPCYFILCLLLLEGTPQTKKVAMGCLLDGPATAEGQTRKLMLNAIASNALPPNGIQSGPQPHSPSGGVNVDSAWPVVPSGGTRTTTLPDITTFKKDLVVMAAGKDKQWMTDPLVTRKTKDTRKVNDVFKPTRGYLDPFAHKTRFSRCVDDDKDLYLTKLADKLRDVNLSFGIIVQVDKSTHTASFVLLSRLEDFTQSEYGYDYVYVFDRGNPECKVDIQSLDNVVGAAMRDVANTMRVPVYEGIIRMEASVTSSVGFGHLGGLVLFAKDSIIPRAVVIAVVGFLASLFGSLFLLRLIFERLLMMTTADKTIRKQEKP